MDDQDLAAALGETLTPDAAVSAESESAERDATTELLTALESGELSLDDDATPDDDAAAEPEIAASEESDEDDEPDERAALLAEVQQLRQEKREIEAARAEAEAAQYWANDLAQVDGRFQQFLSWAAQQAQSQYGFDYAAEVERGVAFYKGELAQHFARREQAVWQVARQYGTEPFLANLAAEHGLSEAEIEVVRKYDPALMPQIAADIAAIRGPLKTALSTTKGQLTKAQHQAERQRLAGLAHPPQGGRGAGARNLVDLITPENADEVAGPLFRAIGIA